VHSCPLFRAEIIIVEFLM